MKALAHFFRHHHVKLWRVLVMMIITFALLQFLTFLEVGPLLGETIFRLFQVVLDAMESKSS